MTYRDQEHIIAVHFQKTLLKTVFIALAPFKVKPPIQPDNRAHWTLIAILAEVVAHMNSSTPPPSPITLNLPESVLRTALNPFVNRMEDPEAPELWVNVQREDHPLLNRSDPKIAYMFKRNPRIAPGDFKAIIEKIKVTIGSLQTNPKYLKVSLLLLSLIYSILKFYFSFSNCATRKARESKRRTCSIQIATQKKPRCSISDLIIFYC